MVAPVDLGAVAVALVFWFESLRPSLLPRPASSQGVVSALALLVGIGFAWLRVRSDSLIAPMLAHLATNSLTYAAAWLVSQ